MTDNSGGPDRLPETFSSEDTVLFFFVALAILGIASLFGSNVVAYILAFWFALLSLSALVTSARLIMYEIGYRGAEEHRTALLSVVTFGATAAIAIGFYLAGRSGVGWPGFW